MVDMMIMTIIICLKNIKNDMDNNDNTRLPGVVPQPLFLILIVFGCIILFEGRLPFSNN